MDKYNYIPSVVEIRHEEQEKSKIYREILSVHENEYAQQTIELMPHLERAREVSKAEVDGNLSKIIKLVEKVPTDVLNQVQINSLGKSIQHLKQYQSEIKNSKNYDVIQVLISQCTEELKKIEDIIKPVLPEKLFNEFKTEANDLSKMLISPHTEQCLEEQLPLAKEPELQPKSKLPIEDNVTPEKNVENQSPSNKSLEQKTSVDINKKEHTNSLAQQPTEVAKETNSRFKSSFQAVKGEGMFSTSNEENPKKYDMALKNISNAFDHAKFNPDLSTETLELIEETENIMKKIKENLSSKNEDLELIQLLYNNLETLSHQCEDLENTKEFLTPFLSYLNNAQQQINRI